jgi:cell division protein FtsW (lipid II flippase)
LHDAYKGVTEAEKIYKVEDNSQPTIPISADYVDYVASGDSDSKSILQTIWIVLGTFIVLFVFLFVTGKDVGIGKLYLLAIPSVASALVLISKVTESQTFSFITGLTICGFFFFVFSMGFDEAYKSENLNMGLGCCVGIVVVLSLMAIFNSGDSTSGGGMSTYQKASFVQRQQQIQEQREMNENINDLME